MPLLCPFVPLTTNTTTTKPAFEAFELNYCSCYTHPMSLPVTPSGGEHETIDLLFSNKIVSERKREREREQLSVLKKVKPTVEMAAECAT